MQSTLAIGDLPFGLIEVDNTGNIVNYKRDEEVGPGINPSDLVGHKLFELPSLSEHRDFRHELDRCRSDTLLAASFRFSFPLKSGDVPARAMVAKVPDRTDAGTAKAIVLQISLA
jgi:hypothetical protein